MKRYEVLYTLQHNEFVEAESVEDATDIAFARIDYQYGYINAIRIDAVMEMGDE